jgi:hypothetical protein
MKLDLFDVADSILEQVESYRHGHVTDDITLIVAEPR